ncbi:hypothetical protein M2157_006647 [Streptomyces sp. SAI-127]|nr:hypothetical protein [Streptomyces sp. SAI-127]
MRVCREGLGEPCGHGGEGGLQAYSVLGSKSVAATVRDVSGPHEVHAVDCRVRAGGGWSRSSPRPCVGHLMPRYKVLALFQDPLRQAYGARRRCHQVHPRVDLASEVVQSARVLLRPHVHQGDHHVPAPRIAPVQVPDGVQDRVACRELVVDQDQGAVAGQERWVLGEEQVGRGVGVGLLEAARGGHTGDRAAGGVEVGGEGDAVGDGVAETCRRLRVAEDDRSGRLLVTQQVADPAAQREALAVDHRRRLRDVLAQHVGDQQMGPLGVAAQRQSQQVGQSAVAHEFDAEPVGDPRPRPEPVVHCLVHASLGVHG